MTGGPGKELGTNKSPQLEEFRKGQNETPRVWPPPRILLSGSILAEQENEIKSDRNQFGFIILLPAFIICQAKRKVVLFLNTAELWDRKREYQYLTFIALKIIPDDFVDSTYVSSAHLLGTYYEGGSILTAL